MDQHLVNEEKKSKTWDDLPDVWYLIRDMRCALRDTKYMIRDTIVSVMEWFSSIREDRVVFLLLFKDLS